MVELFGDGVLGALTIDSSSDDESLCALVLLTEVTAGGALVAARLCTRSPAVPLGEGIKLFNVDDGAVLRIWRENVLPCAARRPPLRQRFGRPF